MPICSAVPFLESILVDRYIHRRVVNGIIRKRSERRISNKRFSDIHFFQSLRFKFFGTLKLIFSITFVHYELSSVKLMYYAKIWVNYAF